MRMASCSPTGPSPIGAVPKPRIVTFAPVRKQNHRLLAELMEAVEHIAADAIMDGLPWDWTTYGGYLDAVERLQPALNVVGLVGHSSIRFEAMGDSVRAARANAEVG